MTTADDLTRRYILRRFREENPDAHLAACPVAAVAESDAHDGEYGCDTGCEYVRFEAVISCPHERTDFTYGQFGDLAMILEDMQRDAG